MQSSLLLLTALVLFATSCSGGPGHPDIDQCVYPPVSSVKDDQGHLIAVAAELDKLPLKGDVKLEFTRVAEQNFGQLSDKNATLLLFLNAIGCYLDKGEIGQAVAMEMAATVRTIWASQEGLAGAEVDLTPIERSLIDRSEHAPAIYTRLKGLGID